MMLYCPDAGAAAYAPPMLEDIIMKYCMSSSCEGMYPCDTLYALPSDSHEAGDV